MKRWTARLVLFALSTPAVALSAQAKSARPMPSPPVRFHLGATGNEARYVVRELLAASTLENDAVGTTSALTGGLVLNGSGKVDSAGSKWTVDLTTLKSDRAMRDRYVQGRTLETDQFPKAQLVVTEIRGLPAVLPEAGTLALTLIGNFTMHGVTKPTTWDVSATIAGSHISGKATTHLKFADFNLTLPRVPVLASLADDIRLEYDFHLIRDTAATP
ncbi:MAG: YceI family protein [Gemmatimonadota bacterium]